jgi:hypothetical protein
MECHSVADARWENHGSFRSSDGNIEESNRELTYVNEHER